MPSTTTAEGRYCNHVIRNWAMNLIAQKHNLRVLYVSKEPVEELGVPLFSGQNEYFMTALLNDDNFLHVLNAPAINFNLTTWESFFQTKDITQLLYSYLRTPEVMNGVKALNPFNERYNNNKDVCVHVRLTDAAMFSPGAQYYLDTIGGLDFDNLYIATDDESHPIHHAIRARYPQTVSVRMNELRTLQFASTCKYLVLSHGSFSGVMGLLAFHTDVYYPAFEADKIWCGDMFSIDGWHKVTTSSKSSTP